MNPEQAKKKITKLTQQIHYYNEQYYQYGNSIVSDYVFDQLLEKLTQLENKFPSLRLENSPVQQIGERTSKNFTSIEHAYPMLSLSNTYSIDEIYAFIKRIKKLLQDEPIEFFCELKFDGVAISIVYKQGILQHIVTRGDGEKGDDITNNACIIRGIPKKIIGINVPFYVEVRGEVFMPRRQFEKLNALRQKQGAVPWSNPRNTAAGTLKTLDEKIVAQRALDCYMYTLITKDTAKVFTQDQAIQQLKNWNFNISSTYKKCYKIEDIINYIHYWEQHKYTLPLDIDGIVIKVNNIVQQQKLSHTTKSPRWAIAYKYAPQNAYTILQKVTYQVGRTGAVTPVAHVKPVQLSGSIIQKASLYNEAYIQHLQLHIGDTVSIEKGGEIIPKITHVDTTKRIPQSVAVHFPTHCPVCHTLLIKKPYEAIYFCANTEHCRPQIQGRIQHYVQRKAMNIMEIGEKTIALLVDQNLLTTPADLYTLHYETIYNLAGFQALSTKNILQGIKDSKKMPFKNVLFALGIRHVGITIAEKLVNYFTNIEQLANASIEELIEVPDIGEKIAISIKEYFQQPKHLSLIKSLQKAGIQFSTNKNTVLSTLKELTFVLSGQLLKFDRTTCKELIQKHGGIVRSTISTKTNYLVIGDKPSPKKLTQATQLAVKIIKENTFLQMINLYNEH